MLIKPLRLGLYCLLLIISLACRADPGTIILNRFIKKVELSTCLKVYEDTSKRLTLLEVMAHPSWFVEPQQFHRQSPRDIYWAQTTIHNPSDEQRQMVLSFNNLSYVHLYILSGDTLMETRSAGTFQPISQIKEGDGREYFTLEIPGNSTYTLYLQVHHTKNYWPSLRFTLQDVKLFQAIQQRKLLLNLLMLGAVGVFLLYSLLSYFVSFYRLYLWLALYIASSGLYALSMKGYLIDWITPEHPIRGWICNIHFIHAAMIGGILLVSNFWKVKEQQPVLYRLFMFLIAGMILISILSFTLDFFWSNYSLMNMINLFYMGFCTVAASYGLIKIWPTLNRPGRILAGGYILYLLGYIIVIVLFAVLRENAIETTSGFVNLGTLLVIVLFSTALKEELHQDQADKNRVLLQLNELQQRQNEDLERLIQERTYALQERNERIETLMLELHHRVKNNLQLLYGLIRLQLPDVGDPLAKDLLRNNLSRIQAMSIVNEKLFQSGDALMVNLADFGLETVNHVFTMYGEQETPVLHLAITPDILLPVSVAVPVGLVLTELLTNSFKHAFLGDTKPLIRLSGILEQEMLDIRYSDNGDMEYHPRPNPRGFSGMMLIRDLVRQLHGSMESWYENGLHYKIKIPVEK
jgi:two-component sensor histidine kinase